MSVGTIAFLFSIATGLAVFVTAVVYEARAGGRLQLTADALAIGVPDKFETDFATRAGMETIRTHVIEAHTLITHRRMAPAAARKFAVALKMEIAAIARARAEKLPPPDPLAPLLEQIAAGAEAVSGDANREPIDGLVDIVGALESYAAKFDHAGWRELQQQ
ncbi:MAG: hypothetical protein ACKVP4_14225 [Hyphomicrobium sp.]